MKIVWFSWKDSGHPQAGGAEAVSSQLMRRLVQDGHQVKLITARYPGSSARQTVDGIEIFRVGNRITVYWRAFWLFRRQLAKWPDLLIDEMNTIPFDCALYSRKPTALLTYQLARRVWFYQAIFPVSLIGYWLEPIYLFVMSRFYKTVVTESESTRRDLQRYGFAANNIQVFRVGTELQPLTKPLPAKKSSTVLVLGAIRPMKQTLDAVLAFELARDQQPELELIIAGDNTGRYANKVMAAVKQSRHASAIKVLGRVPKEEKLRLMRTAAVIVVTSVKEGWGLIVTEANSQGTPAIAYNNDGLRDSIINGKTGVLTKPGDVPALGQAITDLLGDPAKLHAYRQAAYDYSLQFTHQNSYQDFCQALKIDRTA